MYLLHLFSSVAASVCPRRDFFIATFCVQECFGGKQHDIWWMIPDLSLYVLSMLRSWKEVQWFPMFLSLASFNYLFCVSRRRMPLKMRMRRGSICFSKLHTHQNACMTEFHHDIVKLDSLWWQCKPGSLLTQSLMTAFSWEVIVAVFDDNCWWQRGFGSSWWPWWPFFLLKKVLRNWSFMCQFEFDVWIQVEPRRQVGCSRCPRFFSTVERWKWRIDKFALTMVKLASELLERKLARVTESLRQNLPSLPPCFLEKTSTESKESKE